MRFKKGFTLAEILIVLMVLGFLAALTVPALMKGATEAQIKTAYKKAVNSIVNLTTTESVNGKLPLVAGQQERLFDILAEGLDIKSYVSSTDAKLNSNDPHLDTTKYSGSKPTENKAGNWLVGSDGIAYLITKGNTGNCASKSEILAAQETGITAAGTTQTTAVTGGNYVDSPLSGTDGGACYVIYVDVNGLSKGPNSLVPQENKITTDDTPQILVDQFPIYVGRDGAVAGNTKTTITGRLATDGV